MALVRAQTTPSELAQTLRSAGKADVGYHVLRDMYLMSSNTSPVISSYCCPFVLQESRITLELVKREPPGPDEWRQYARECPLPGWGVYPRLVVLEAVPALHDTKNDYVCGTFARTLWAERYRAILGATRQLDGWIAAWGVLPRDVRANDLKAWHQGLEPESLATLGDEGAEVEYASAVASFDSQVDAALEFLDLCVRYLPARAGFASVRTRLLNFTLAAGCGQRFREVIETNK